MIHHPQNIWVTLPWQEDLMSVASISTCACQGQLLSEILKVRIWWFENYHGHVHGYSHGHGHGHGHCHTHCHWGWVTKPISQTLSDPRTPKNLSKWKILLNFFKLTPRLVRGGLRLFFFWKSFFVKHFRDDRRPKNWCFFGKLSNGLDPPPSFFGNYIALFSRKSVKYA